MYVAPYPALTEHGLLGILSETLLAEQMSLVTLHQIAEQKIAIATATLNSRVGILKV